MGFTYCSFLSNLPTGQAGRNDDAKGHFCESVVSLPAAGRDSFHSISFLKSSSVASIFFLSNTDSKLAPIL